MTASWWVSELDQVSEPAADDGFWLIHEFVGEHGTRGGYIDGYSREEEKKFVKTSNYFFFWKHFNDRKIVPEIFFQFPLNNRVGQFSWLKYL